MYRLNVRIHSRGQGRASMVKAAAYRSGTRLDERADHASVNGSRDPAAAAAYRAAAVDREHQVHDFRGKRGVVASEIHAPQDTPARLLDRGELWREVERVETRKNARLSREVVVTVPRGLDREQGVDLVRGWVNEQCVSRGQIADVNWHEVRARDGGGNFHAHVLTTTREVTAEGFGRKVREWDGKAMLREWRSSWQEHVNWHLQRAGRAERVDCRSLVAQRAEALERRDFAKVAATDREARPRLDRDGSPSERGREVIARNQARAAIYDRLEIRPEGTRAAFLAQRKDLGDPCREAGAWRERAPWVALAAGLERDHGREVDRDHRRGGRGD